MAKLRRDERSRFNRDTWTRCGECHGRGLIQPMLAANPEYACPSCNAVGWIPPDGEALSEAEALVMLRRSCLAMKQRVMLAERAREEDGRGYGEGRYMGD